MDNFVERVELLKSVSWGAAPAWMPGTERLLLAHYQRLLPVWPAERKYLAPVERQRTADLWGRLTGAEQSQVEHAVQEILTSAAARGLSLEPTTSQLLPILLAWSLEVDLGRLTKEEDPGEPLVTLFQQGFQLNYTDAGIELQHLGGWQSMAPPERAFIATLGASDHAG